MTKLYAVMRKKSIWRLEETVLECLVKIPSKKDRKMMQMSPGDRQMPRVRAAGSRLFAGGFVLLVLALGFNALLTYGSLEKLYVEAIVSSYQVVGKTCSESSNSRFASARTSKSSSA